MRFGRVGDVATVVLRVLTFRLRAWLSLWLFKLGRDAAGRGVAEAAVVVDVLELAGRRATVAEVAAWTRPELEDAARWAVREIDAEDARPGEVARLPVPDHVARLPRTSGAEPEETAASFFAPEPKRGPVPMGREVAACASCGVDETLSDDLTGLTASDRLLCFDCASEEAAAVVAAAMRDPATVRVIDEAKRSGAWAEAMGADGWEPGEEGDIPTARVISKLMEPIEQRRADRADLAALLRLLGSTDAVARTSCALARGETMAQAWERWTAADREKLSDVLALDVTTASWELVRGVL